MQFFNCIFVGYVGEFLAVAVFFVRLEMIQAVGGDFDIFRMKSAYFFYPVAVFGPGNVKGSRRIGTADPHKFTQKKGVAVRPVAAAGPVRYGKQCQL